MSAVSTGLMRRLLLGGFVEQILASVRAGAAIKVMCAHGDTEHALAQLAGDEALMALLMAATDEHQRLLEEGWSEQQAAREMHAAGWTDRLLDGFMGGATQ